MKRFAILVTSTLLLAACGSGTPAADTTTDTPTASDEAADTTVTTENGTFSDQNTLPEGWPADVPQYPQTTIQYSGTVNPATGAGGMAAAFVTTADATTVTKEYTDMIKNAGWAIQGTMNSGGANVISATKDTRTLAVYIGGSEGTTVITVGIETK